MHSRAFSNRLTRQLESCREWAYPDPGGAAPRLPLCALFHLPASAVAWVAARYLHPDKCEPKLESPGRRPRCPKWLWLCTYQVYSERTMRNRFALLVITILFYGVACVGFALAQTHPSWVQ